MEGRHIRDTTDEELVLLAATTDPQAFETLVDRYKNEILNFIYRYLNDFHKAEDAAQETFIRAYRNLAKFNPEQARFKTWLYTIARNVTRTAARGRKLRLIDGGQETGLGSQVTSSDPIPVDKAAEKEMVSDALVSIKSLLEGEREVIHLHVLCGLKLSEVAQMTETPLTTVCYRYQKALERLRAALSGHAPKIS